MIFLAVAMVWVPLTDVRAQTPTENAPLPAQNSVVQLSQPTREVIKMVSSGVPEAVLKAYVQNAPSMFNLTADNIVNLQGIGVPADVMTSMLARDTQLRDNNSAQAAAAEQLQPQAMTPDASYSMNDSSAPPDATDYSALAPYGTWGDSPDYGSYWQPNVGLAYDAYPWGLLGAGFWFNVPGRGFCWFPHSRFGFGRFNGFNRINGVNRFNRFNNFNRVGTFTFNRFNGGFRSGVRSAGFNRSFGVNRSFSGARSFSPGIRSFGGGSSGGSHFSGGGHSSGGHTGGGMSGGHR